MSGSYVPRVFDPRDAGFWPDINLCMQLFDRLVEAWPDRTIVPSLAERWEISDDGLRYVFHLREGLRWSDGTPLTAHDWVFGIRRMLDPAAPGASAPIYFVLENGEEYFLGHSDDAEAIGVRALDDRTVEFRLVAPAPYFMSVVNRPDSGPLPQHAIERDGDDWTDPERQVVSGPFRQLEHGDARLVLVRNESYTGAHPGNVARVEITRATADEAAGPLERGELDLVRVMYTPRTSDHVRSQDRGQGPLTWTAYLGFRHSDPALGDRDLRLALAYAIDRSALEPLMPANLEVATGGIVPPALQGHTPDIVLPFDPDRARAAPEVLRSVRRARNRRAGRLEAAPRRDHPLVARDSRPRDLGAGMDGRERRRGRAAREAARARADRCPRLASRAIPIPSTACASSCTRTRRRTRDGTPTRRSTC